ncbi:TPA: D-TA family PLP-dependent enzyme [Candidatus Poribacteria bacterium]|nr:D-TA family PLP-dependent enzyme [Candidatus Poribacteria bacterium]
MHFSQLDTPALTLDLDVMERNITNLQQACDKLEIGLRVHTKTHKTPAVAQMQMQAGAIGIVCQKLGEARVMVDAGIEDVLIPYNIVGKPKLERLTQLILRNTATITVAADSVTTVDGLSQQAVQDECSVRVIVEMDTGGGRCGVQSPTATVELAQHIDRAPNLEFMGVMTYASGERVPPFFDQVRDLIKKVSLPLHIISAGGTGSQEFCQSIGCTETRIGSYIYEGMTRVGKREDLHPNRCPLRMVTTVVSNARPGQVIVDAGQKAFTSYPPRPYGYCIEHPEIFIQGMSVEHGHVDINQSSHNFEVGEILSFIPLHGGMTTNLHNQIYPVRNGEVIDTWEVAGRGKAQ